MVYKIYWDLRGIMDIAGRAKMCHPSITNGFVFVAGLFLSDRCQIIPKN